MQAISQDFANVIRSDRDIWGGKQLINDLQAKAQSVLDPLIPTDSALAVLDYPNNSNVGGSLIWLGETSTSLGRAFHQQIGNPTHGSGRKVGL